MFGCSDLIDCEYVIIRVSTLTCCVEAPPVRWAGNFGTGGSLEFWIPLLDASPFLSLFSSRGFQANLANDDVVELSGDIGESLKPNGIVPEVTADNGSPPDIVDKVKQEGEPLSDGDLQPSVALSHDDGLLCMVRREGPMESIFLSRREKETVMPPKEKEEGISSNKRAQVRVRPWV